MLKCGCETIIPKILILLDIRVGFIGLIFSFGCEKCCQCKGEAVSTVTIPVSGITNYPGRSCPLPTTDGDYSQKIGGSIIKFLQNKTIAEGGGLTSNKYYMWVEFSSNCEKFATSFEFVTLKDKGLAFYSNSGGKTYDYFIVLNGETASSSPSSPFPTSEKDRSGPVTLKYYETCLTPGEKCDLPLLCVNKPYRNTFYVDVPIPWNGSKPHENVTTTSVKLQYFLPQCELPDQSICN